MFSRMSVRFAALVGVAALALGSAGYATADAGSHASCIGLEASGISPHGSSDEFPGGMPELQAFVKDAFPGVPSGAIVSATAKVHAGSHAECDASE
jgi:hypothetical protein